MKVWRVSILFGYPKIYEDTCVKATEKTIFFEHNRVLRVSICQVFFDDYQSAINYALDFAKKAITHNQNVILGAQKAIENLNKLISEYEGEK